MNLVADACRCFVFFSLVLDIAEGSGVHMEHSLALEVVTLLRDQDTWELRNTASQMAAKVPTLKVLTASSALGRSEYSELDSNLDSAIGLSCSQKHSTSNPCFIKIRISYIISFMSVNKTKYLVPNCLKHSILICQIKGWGRKKLLLFLFDFRLSEICSSI